MATVDEAFVRIMPDTSQFASRLQADLNRLSPDLTVFPRLSNTATQSLQRELDRLRGLTITVLPQLNTGTHAQLQAQLSQLHNLQINVNTNINTSQLNQLNSSINRTQGGANGLRTAFTGAFAALQARSLQQSIGQLSGLSDKITLLAGAGTSAVSVLGPLTGLVAGLGAAAGVAGAGVGAFALLAMPSISAVNDAVDSVTKAQTAYNQALASGDSDAATKALQDQQAALAALDPAQRAAAQSRIGFNAALQNTSSALEPITSSLYSGAFKTLTDLLPRILPLAQAAGTALQGIFGRLQGALAGPGLDNLVSQLSDLVGPVLDSLSVTASNFGKVLFNLFQAAQPLITPVINLIQRLTGTLANASGAGGLAGFFREASTLIVPLGAAVQSVGAAFSTLVSAALPLAGPVLDAINVLADTLRGLFQSFDFGSFVANVGAIISGLLPALQPLADAIGTILSTISGQVLDLIPQLVPVITQFADVFSQVVVGISPLLPAILQLVSALVSLLPTLYPIITAVRTALVPVFDVLASTVRSLQPAFQAIAGVFIDLAPLVGRLLSALLPLVGTLINAFAPVLDGLVKALVPLIPLFTKIATLIAGYFVQAITLILKAVTPLLPMLSQFAEKLLTALLDVLQQLQPYLLSAIKSFVGMLPALVPLIGAVVNLVTAFLPLLPVLEEMELQLLPLFVGAIKAVAAILTFLINDALVPVVRFLVGVFRPIFQSTGPIVEGIFRGIGNAASFLWKNVLAPVFYVIGVAWSGLVDGMKTVYHTVLEPIWGFFQDGIGAVASAVGWVVGAIETVWGKLGGILAWPVNHVLAPIIRNFASAVDAVLGFIGIKRYLQGWENWAGVDTGGGPNPMGQTGPASVVGHHSTGVGLPGYGGGDIIPAMLEPGEAVIRKESVRAMGGPAAVHDRFNRSFTSISDNYGGVLGDVLHAVTHNPVTDFIGGAVKTVFGGAFDVGKWVLSEAAGLLRRGAAAAFDTAYKVMSAPLFALLPNTGWGSTVKGVPNTIESKFVDWIRGKESDPIVGTLAGGQAVPYTGGSNTVGLIEQLATTLGVPDLPVTSTFRPNAGYHGQYEAVDFSNGPGYGPGSQTPQELAFDLAWARKYGSSLAELIHAQPGAINIKDGKIVDGLSFYGAATMMDHWNHVHVAISPESIARGGGKFDDGGFLMPGAGFYVNGTGAPEPVLTNPQWDNVSRLVSALERLVGQQRTAPIQHVEHQHIDSGVEPTAVAQQLAFYTGGR